MPEKTPPVNDPGFSTSSAPVPGKVSRETTPGAGGIDFFELLRKQKEADARANIIELTEPASLRKEARRFKTEDLSLNAGQEQAIRDLVRFVMQSGSDRPLSHVLIGFAGTGKTTIVRLFVNWFTSTQTRNVVLVAPTHRAKTVLSRIGGKTKQRLVCDTVHQMLRLRPEMKSEELDLRNIEFNQTGASRIAPGSLIICDEASMINDGMYDVLLEQARQKRAQILFVGDSAQLKPVKQARISKVFLTEAYSQLNEVMRQANGNPIGYLLQTIRNNQLAPTDAYLRYDRVSPSNEGIVFTNSSSHCKAWVIDRLKELGPDRQEDGLRILCATNKRVAQYNLSMRNTLHGEGVPEYVPGEILTGYNNYGKDAYENYLITNSADYIVQAASAERRTLLEDVTVDGWQLTVREPGSEVNRRLFIIARDCDGHSLSVLGQHARSLYQRANKLRRGTEESRAAWDEYFFFQESFCTAVDYMQGKYTLLKKTLDYGYALTVHKSQGGTYDYVLVDEGDIDGAFWEDHQLRHQLKYVAFSRASKQVMCLTNQLLEEPTFDF